MVLGNDIVMDDNDVGSDQTESSVEFDKPLDPLIENILKYKGAPLSVGILHCHSTLVEQVYRFDTPIVHF